MKESLKLFYYIKQTWIGHVRCRRGNAPCRSVTVNVQDPSLAYVGAIYSASRKLEGGLAPWQRFSQDLIGLVRVASGSGCLCELRTL